MEVEIMVIDVRKPKVKVGIYAHSFAGDGKHNSLIQKI